MKIQIFSAPRCVACDSTKLFLRNADVRYTEIDVTQDDAALDQCRQLGYSELPVVVAGDQTWSGFRFDRLRALRAELRGSGCPA